MAVPDIAPMLATLGDRESAREPGGWHFEVKWDGWRAVAHVEDAGLRLRSRGGLDLLGGFPQLSELVGLLGGHDAVLDGEVVALLPDGRSSFEQLHNSKGSGRTHLMLFDLLHLDGLSLLELGYEERRALLADLVGDGTDHVHVPATFGTDRETALAASEQLGLEGLIAKRGGSTYLPGRRSRAWLKIKNVRRQDVVVVGYTAGSGRRAGGIGSLLLAVPGSDGLVYAGHAGSGFTDAALDDALARLAPLAVPGPTVPGVPTAEARGATWVSPVTVGSVTFGEWTATGRLRHPVWRGFRDDVHPADVVRDEG